MDRFLRKATGGEQLQHALAQQVDRADLAIEAAADDLDDVVELGLRGAARGHDFVEASQDGARGGDRGRDRAGGDGGGHGGGPERPYGKSMASASVRRGIGGRHRAENPREIAPIAGQRARL